MQKFKLNTIQFYKLLFIKTSLDTINKKEKPMTVKQKMFVIEKEYFLIAKKIFALNHHLFLDFIYGIRRSFK